MGFRLSSVAGLAVCATLLLGGCGGGSGKPRPDIVFVSTRSGVYDIYAMNADGSRQQRLTHGSSGNSSTPQGLDYENYPSWSRNGRQIAFESARNGALNIFVMDADGKNVRQLTVGSFEDTKPTWSPDGKRIAFVRGRSGRIFVMNSDGTGVHRITHGSTAESDPAWSPDGRWIAFVRVTQGTSNHEIWLVHPDGTGARQLTTLVASTDSPAWSPDSRQLAASSDARGGTFAIYTIGVGGLGLRLVSGTKLDAFSPAWSPDGKTIAFSRNGAIVTATVGGAEKVITDPKDNDSSPVWNPVRAPVKSKAKGY